MRLLMKHRTALQRQIREALEIEASGAEIVLQNNGFDIITYLRNSH